MIQQLFDSLEGAFVEVSVRLGPILAPAVTAFLVARATLIHLAWPWPVAVLAGLTIECLGVSATNTALVLRSYNRGKRKSDPAAPLNLALALTVAYFVVAVALTIAVDVLPSLVRLAPAIFPALSLCAAGILAIRSDHKQRLAAIATDKAERRARRKASKTRRRSVQDTVQEPVQHVVQASVQDAPTNGRAAHPQSVQDGELHVLNVQRQALKQAKLDKMLDILLDNPNAGASALARTLDVSRSTVYNYRDELERSGRLSQNGKEPGQ